MLTIIVVITYIIQTTLIQNFNIMGIYPNLFLIVTCGIAFLFGSFSGGVTGLSLGLLNDFYQGRNIGLYAILGLYLGIILGQFNKRFFKDNYLVVLILIVLSTVFYELFIYLFGVIVYSQNFDFIRLIVKLFLITVTNVIAVTIIYPILLKVNLGFEIDRNIFKY